MSASFGQTIGPASGLVRSWQKYAGSRSGLEDAAVVEEVREVDIRGEAVLEADVDDFG